jgi:protein-glutamine gamma-glutamyltransferase
MTELSQFRPTLYFLLILGLTGFAIATQTTSLWVFAMSGLMLNAWLIKTGRFVPLPRLVATLITIVAAAYVARELRAGETVIIGVGEFLVMLHLVKLYEQRSNRDYAQLLVLSLLLMAAGISTASLFFGVMMVVYLLVSLYCSLLFHLKVEADAARAAAAGALPASMPAPEKVNPAAVRQDQRRLSASMLLLTALVSLFSIGMGIAVFLFFPRGATEDLWGRRLFPPPQVVSGLTDHVSMDQVAQISQSDQMVAAVKVKHDGKPWGGEQPLLLRGVTLDIYTGMPDKDSPVPPYHWERSDDGGGLKNVSAVPERFTPFDNRPVELAGDYEQEIELQPTGSPPLPGMAGAHAVESDSQMSIWYSLRDGAMRHPLNDPLSSISTLHYRVRSTGRPPDIQGAPPQSKIDPRIRAYAMRPDVSGVDDAGRPLASLRGTPQAPPDIDERIAMAIQRHLRAPPFEYTLDLTASRDILESEDPMVAFLYRVKRGHCEYYAGAMTLLCQSLGMDARMVVGYHCDYYNSVGQLYIVLASQAHAWVEVRTDQGWQTFDPTTGNQAVTSDSSGVFGRIKSLMNYLQYEWGASVVAYGKENRDNIVIALNNSVTNEAIRSSDSLKQIPSMLDNALNWLSALIDNPTPISILATLMVLSMVAFVAYYAWEKLRLRRRAWRIGLFGLPNRQRQRLARELGFYDDLVRLLERHGLVRKPNWTPMEFSDGLSYLPYQVYHDIRRLTRLFYRVRYGRRELNPRRRHRVYNAIARIEAILG